MAIYTEWLRNMGAAWGESEVKDVQIEAKFNIRVNWLV